MNGSNAVVTWVTVAFTSGTTYTITATPTTADDSLYGTQNIKLKVVLDSYNTITSNFDLTVTVSYATCSCNAIVWQAGTYPTGSDIKSIAMGAAS